MFRAIYSKAKGAVRVTGADGVRQVSREFDIKRGTRPPRGHRRATYFLIALAYVFKIPTLEGPPTAWAYSATYFLIALAYVFKIQTLEGPPIAWAYS